tara:strand:+ start:258 stop:719 length:462 start_codon:yes stop_codon:yes gene_type:complete
MSNWLFLMLLYGFFGWMKKRQRDKARDKIESQDDWESGGIVDFGEGILEAIIGDEESTTEKPNVIKEEDNEEEENLDGFEEVLVNSPEIEPEISLKENEALFNEVPIRSTDKSKIYNKNTKLANLIDLQDPIKTGVIFKEIFDKPKSLRVRRG